MSRFELFDTGPFRPTSHTPRSHLPFHVEPGPDEALISWLRRLAARIGISTRTLIGPIFGMQAQRVHLQWWRHPDPALLAHIHERTGIGIERLRAMTFSQWATHARDDDATERLSARRFIAPIAQQRRACPVVVCPACLSEGAQPYLRLPWTIGWLAACPRHATVLTTHCPACRVKLQLPALTSRAPWRADHCCRCDAPLTELKAPAAHPLVLRLQEALLAGRLQGSTSLPGLGSMSWTLALAAADVLLGIVFAAHRRRREKLYRRIARELGHSRAPQRGDCEQRYGSLAMLAWLLERWPRNVRSAFTILQAPRLKSFLDDWCDMGSELRVALSERLSCIVPKRPIERIAWLPWLERLTYTGEELRARADGERDKHRRLRLWVFAELRNGCSIREVALSADVWPRTIYRWLNCATRYGLDAFLARTVSRSGLTSAQAAEIAQWLDDALDPSTLDFTVIEPEDVLGEVWARFGIEIPVQAARSILCARLTRADPRRRSRQLRELSSRNRNPVHG